MIISPPGRLRLPFACLRRYRRHALLLIAVATDMLRCYAAADAADCCHADAAMPCLSLLPCRYAL